MGQKTDIKQRIQNEIDNKFQTSIAFNIDKKCIQGTDASNIIEDIKIRGGKNITIDQVNSAQSMCALKTVIDNELLGEIQSEAKGALLDILKQESGLGVQVTDKTQDVMNTIKNDVGIDVEFNIAEKCLQDTIAQNRVSGIVMDDVQNVKISQVNSAFNNCIMDEAIKQGVALKAVGKAAADVKGKTEIKGMNPIADLMNGLGGMMSALGFGMMMPLLLAGSPIISCCCIVIAIAAFMMIGGTGGGEGSAIAEGAAEGAAGAVGEGVMGAVMDKILGGGGASPIQQIVDRTGYLLNNAGKFAQTNW
jgi:hypothetical protein